MIVVWNQKGGVGKSTVSLLLQTLTQRKVVTTEVHMEKFFSKKNTIFVQPHRATIPMHENAIYDLPAGYDMRGYRILCRSELVIVPFCPKEIDMHITKSALQVLKKDFKSKRFLLVANMTKNSNELNFFPEQNVVHLRESKLLRKISEINLAQLTNFQKYIYRNVLKDIEQLKNEVKNDQ